MSFVVANNGRRCTLLVALLAAAFVAAHGESYGADPAQTPAPAAGDELSVDQARLADRYNRLETVLARLAELSASTDPRRAKILREAVAKSRDEGLDEHFESIVSLLEDERLSAAAGRQTELQKQLDELLALLLKADRDRELDSQHKRIKAYLKEVGRLIRLQKGLEARTEGGDETQRLAKDQQQVGDQTGELGKTISDTERPADKSADAKSGDKSDDQAQKGDKPSGDAAKDAKPGEAKPTDTKSGDAKSGDNKSGDNKSGDNKSGENGKPQPAKPSSAPAPGDSQQSPGNPSDGKPSPGSPGKSGQPGQPSQSGESSPQNPSEQPQQEPTDRAAERLKAAEEAMQKAKKQLDDAEREGAAADQREAVKQLEQAKAELERVLRQLREEEMERTLTLLAARFRKMLEAQTRIYEGTQRVDRVPEAERSHDEEIEAARLSREESLIVREADRALVLLREEGSSMAFPETVSLMRDDMQQVTERLADAKVGKVTQDLEQDIIEALEETIAALDKAIRELDKKKTRPGQSPPAGQQDDPPLVDKLAELKMIRSLQMRINRRTQRYGKIIEGEQAEAPELLEALTKLAQRQERVYQATSDLSQGRND
jgi:hypothetical protein